MQTRPAPFCLHEHDEHRAGAPTGFVIACAEPATVGPFCAEHAPKSDNARAPYRVQVLDYSEEFATFAEALAFYRASFSEATIYGAAAEPSDENGDGGTDGLSEDERLLVEYAADAPALPARRAHDVAETITAAPTAEALALAAEMSGLRTTVACLSGALFGLVAS